jgi:hypothetical protein
MPSHQGRKAWYLIRNSRSGPKSMKYHHINCVAKKHELSLIRKSCNSQKKAQHQTRQLGSWKARPRIRTPQQGPPKNMKTPWGHLRRNTPTSWTHNRRIWDKGQKAIIKEECSHNGHTSMAYHHEANLLRVSLSWVTNHINIPLFQGAVMGRHSISRLLQHHNTISLPSFTAQSAPPTPNPPPDGTLQITQ